MVNNTKGSDFINIYTVKSGDSVYSLADRFNVSPYSIITGNALKPPYSLVVGQSLVISYDYTNLNNDAYKLKYTAYAALINKTAVCQGYANLFYRLMLELGVDCRIITGIGNGGPHGWNIVCLEGKYYNLDASSDTGFSASEYYAFLKCDSDMVKYTRNPEFQTEEFQSAYPMAKKSY